MTQNEIKEKIKTWLTEMQIEPSYSNKSMPFTIGDLQMFAFDSVVNGPEVEKGVSTLANDGFLCYVESTVKNPLTGEYLLCFKKV